MRMLRVAVQAEGTQSGGSGYDCWRGLRCGAGDCGCGEEDGGVWSQQPAKAVVADVLLVSGHRQVGAWRMEQSC